MRLGQAGRCEFNACKIYLTLAAVENLGSTRLATSCRTGLK